jgi:hypothetical protein
MITKKPVDQDRDAYLSECRDMLGGNDTVGVFIGIAITLVVFGCLISFPWIMSCLQDRGILKPRIYFNENLELNSHLRTRNEQQQPAPAEFQPTTYANTRFGHPN